MPYKPVRIAGNRRETGQALGKLARPLMSAYLEQNATWHALRPWRGHAYLQELAGHAQEALPEIWEEFEGLAEGLRMPADDLLLWHCRGDLLHKSTDGCTSVALQSPGGKRWIAHNEDGDPYLYGRCHVVDVRPTGAPGYVSFYYPGSLPGHTFGASRAGVVQTINNLRIRTRRAGVPRMFLARAVLDCTSLDQAAELLARMPRAGGFHHTLGAAGDHRLLSVEATPGACSVETVARRYGHANHAIHQGTQDIPQVITDSSRARQNRIDMLVDTWNEQTGEAELVGALHDCEGPLPILRRAPDDPDDENTLATAVFALDDDHVTLRIYDRKPQAAQEIVVA